MGKETYLQELNDLLTENNKGKRYITKCKEYASKLLDNKLPVIFDTKHLSLLIGIESKELSKMLFTSDKSPYYIEKNIPKKSGGTRKILIPSVTLKYIQRWILNNILNNINISEYATGFCQNKSVVTNAQRHIKKDCIINMDIKDFFPTITMDDVFRIFYYYGYTKEVSFVLSKLCTYQYTLPQGSPASPYLSNIVCLKLDKRLSALANKFNANYSRYADDITISGSYGIKKCIQVVEQILNDEGFTVNSNKTRLAYSYQRQEVTGLVVNQGRVSINKAYKRKLKQEIYYYTKFGVADHLDHIGCTKSFYKEHLYGKACFVRMVETEVGDKFINMLDKIEWDY